MTLEESRRWSDDFARTHRSQVEERAKMPRGTAAYADWRQRLVVVSPITDDVSFAIRVHEFGHVLAGDCPNTRPHYRNPKVREWWHCVQCEADAWHVATREVPFTRAMFKRLQSSLATYRRSTPAHPEALAAARSLASDSAYAAEVLRREWHADLPCKIRDIELIHSSPPVLKRWQRQYAEIQQIAKEAGWRC